jgi:hypothetical protein
MYGTVLAVHTSGSLYVFEKISASWTQTGSYTTGTFTNIQMYSNFIVAGNSGWLLSSDFDCLFFFDIY